MGSQKAKGAIQGAARMPIANAAVDQSVKISKESGARG
jgi:hypothetical protein